MAATGVIKWSRRHRQCDMTRAAAVRRDVAFVAQAVAMTGHLSPGHLPLPENYTPQTSVRLVTVKGQD